MHRGKVRSSKLMRPFGRRPTKNSLCAWYVVKARLRLCCANQPEKLREVEISKCWLAAVVPVVYVEPSETT